MNEKLRELKEIQSKNKHIQLAKITNIRKILKKSNTEINETNILNYLNPIEDLKFDFVEKKYFSMESKKNLFFTSFSKFKIDDIYDMLNKIENVVITIDDNKINIRQFYLNAKEYLEYYQDFKIKNPEKVEYLKKRKIRIAKENIEALNKMGKKGLLSQEDKKNVNEELIEKFIFVDKLIEKTGKKDFILKEFDVEKSYNELIEVVKKIDDNNTNLVKRFYNYFNKNDNPSKDINNYNNRDINNIKKVTDEITFN